MLTQLTGRERQQAMVACAAVGAISLAFTFAGWGDLIAVHGVLAALYAAGCLYLVYRYRSAPEPSPERLKSYYDDPTRVGIILSLIWGVFGMGAGVWVAWMMAYPEATFNAAWSSFGRMRPVHTTGVIFGFGGNALIATSFHVVQRTSRARLPDQFSPWFVLIGYNLFVLLAVIGYPLGISQSKEYAEPEWYLDIWLVIVWVAYLLLYLRTLAKRQEPHIYVANWYYLAFILVVAVLHIVNNLAVPIGFGAFKSYSLFSGVQDAMTQWWYGHNAVAFFLTSGFLGMLYYYLPKTAGRPIFSYRMSIISFWGITFMYMWAGSHHLHYTALPQWVQSLGVGFSVMLLVPSWGSAANALLTLNGAWQKVRDEATLRFMMIAAVFYGLSTFEGSFMAIRPVNSLSHYTDWTIGHVHSGALGWVAFIVFGSVYSIVPSMWKRKQMYSRYLVELHFWLALSGTLIYLISLWNAGITQGLMWRTYDESGELAYSFLESMIAMKPYYVARGVGGFLFLLGACLCLLNVVMTIRQARAADRDSSMDISKEAAASDMPITAEQRA